MSGNCRQNTQTEQRNMAGDASSKWRKDTGMRTAVPSGHALLAPTLQATDVLLAPTDEFIELRLVHRQAALIGGTLVPVGALVLVRPQAVVARNAAAVCVGPFTWGLGVQRVWHHIRRPTQELARVHLGTPQ